MKGSVIMKKALFIILLAILPLSACSRDLKAERDKYYESGHKFLEENRLEEASIQFRNALRADGDHLPSYLGIAKVFRLMGDHRNAIASYQQVIRLDARNIEAKLELGDYLLASGINNPELYKQAQQMAEDVLEIEPSNVAALILLGNAYSGQDEITPSIHAYERVLSLDPDNIRAMLNLAATRFKNNEIDKAEATFKETLRKHPESIDAHLSIAAFYSSIRRAQETEKYLNAALELHPADSRVVNALAAFYMSSNRIVEAEGVFADAIARNPQEAGPRLGLADFYFRQGRVEMGVETLEEVLKVRPANRTALLRLTDVYLHRNELERAEEHTRALLASNRNDAQANYFQGVIHRRNQNPDLAMKSFETAIELNAGLMDAYLEKANLLLVRGDIDESEATLNEAMKQNRDYLPIRAAYARMLAIRQKPEEALRMAQEVLARVPDSEDALAGRADALRLLGRLDESRRDWIRLSEMRPQNGLYWQRLGLVEATQGNAGSAMTNLRKAVELQPGMTDAIGVLLQLHLREKKYDAALSELDRLEKLSTPSDEIHRFRGQVLFAKGDLRAAEQEFRKALEINPRNYQIYLLLGNLSLRQDNIEQAIREVDELIATNDRLPYAYLLKAAYLERKKDEKGAMNNYRKVLDLDENNYVAANNLAWLMGENEINLEEALSLARNARKLNPNNPEIADTLGWIYYKLKNYTLAVDQFTFGINNRQQSTAEHYHRLGLALHAKGDHAPARQTLRKALDLDASYPGADEARRILQQTGN
jgi:tetratricopeptide (TPR) repeat protein